MWAAAAAELLQGKSFGQFSGSYISPGVFKDRQNCQREQSIFKNVFSAPSHLFLDCILNSENRVLRCSERSWKQGNTLTQGEKTYLPVALHWVCHLNKIQASTVRSREVLGQWKKWIFEHNYRRMEGGRISWFALRPLLNYIIAFRSNKNSSRQFSSHSVFRFFKNYWVVTKGNQFYFKKKTRHVEIKWNWQWGNSLKMLNLTFLSSQYEIN